MMLGLGLQLGAGELGVFTPKSIAGAVLWLRADLGVTLVSGKVSAWADQSGAGDANKNATQSNATLRPVVNATGIGGKPVIEFAGAQELATGAWSANLPQPATWMYVVRATATGIAVVVDGISGAHRHLFTQSSSSFADINAGNDITSAREFHTTDRVVIGVFNGASSKLYVSQATPTTGDTGTDDATGAVIGAFTDGTSFPLTGYIAEIAAWSRALNATEVGQLNAYASARYGIAIAA